MTIKHDMPPSAPRPLQQLLAEEPDLVDKIFDYLVDLLPELKQTPAEVTEARRKVRSEFSGIETYVRKRDARDLSAQVLALFNGRNATEVARRLGISKATVYRCLKQPGGPQSQ